MLSVPHGSYRAEKDYREPYVEKTASFLSWMDPYAYMIKKCGLIRAESACADEATCSLPGTFWKRLRPEPSFL